MKYAREHAGALAVVDPSDREQVRPVADAHLGPGRRALPRLGIRTEPEDDLGCCAQSEQATDEGGFRVGLEHEPACCREDVAEHWQADRRLVVRGRMHDRALTHRGDSDDGRLVEVRVEHNEVGRRRSDRVEELGAVRALPSDPVPCIARIDSVRPREQRA